ncbi:hypothetical protein RHSIM_Rhsim02G0164700 [Rhododendron simsii]|uniref:Protein kinase domain-containing protein n=1 Tax=Rhododendron simsii TaxID=118357 RepID=A0A834HET9_RHOSS|nr:hypothetical protein RHSIM_Rhsim02G0164700 [Rhododendron simsii]
MFIALGWYLLSSLVGKKSILLGKSNEGGSLTAYFLLTMKENWLYDILDAGVVKEGGKEEILAFANIAKRCLYLNGSSRSTMKEVVMEVDGIRMSNAATTTIEVPMLVYEFIPNGTLFQYIHDQNEEFPLTWDLRLRIATEIAGALFYLHSAASIAIYHRDIKSTSVDKTHLTTAVQGTFGYLDPEYFQSNQFTEKSDVYSFGVVLVELLTGKMPILSGKSNEGGSLTAYFLLKMKENRLYDILGARVVKEGGKEEILAFANIAKRCVYLNGSSRPTMKEVAMELDGIRMSNGTTGTVKQSYDNVDYATEDVLTGPWEAASTSTGSFYRSMDIEPLLLGKSSSSLHSFNPPKPFINSINLEALKILVNGSTVQVNNPVITYNCSGRADGKDVDQQETPFTFSDTYNRFTGLGCNNLALVVRKSTIQIGCMSICNANVDSSNVGKACFRINCCQTRIPPSLRFVNASLRSIDPNNTQAGRTYAFMVDYQWFSDKDIFNVRAMEYVPLDWALNGTSNMSESFCGANAHCLYNDNTSWNPKCFYDEGYEGNPYLHSGCQDIDECSNPSLNCFVKGAGKEEILAVVHVPKRCLSLKGRKRPTMKEVVMEFDAIRMQMGHLPLVKTLSSWQMMTLLDGLDLGRLLLLQHVHSILLYEESSSLGRVLVTSLVVHRVFHMSNVTCVGNHNIRLALQDHFLTRIKLCFVVSVIILYCTVCTK